jgi:hypothetical protein
MFAVCAVQFQVGPGKTGETRYRLDWLSGDDGTRQFLLVAPF